LDLIKQDNIIVSKFSTDLSFESAINGVQISFLKNNQGEKVAVAFISKCIREIGMFYNASFEAPTIVMISTMILNKYWYMKAEEIILVFRNALIGHYGQVYGNLSIAVLIQWFEKHEMERNGVFESEHELRKSEFNGSDSDRIGGEPLSDHFSDLVKDEAKKMQKRAKPKLNGYYLENGEFVEYDT